MAAGDGNAGFDFTATVGGDTAGKAKDVEVNMGANLITTTTRDANGWKTVIQGVKEWDASIPHLWVPTDTVLQALQAAYFSGADVACVFTDPDGYGFSGNAKVANFGRGEPLEDGAEAAVELTGNGALTPIVPSS